MPLLRKVRPGDAADAAALTALLDRSTTSSAEVDDAVRAILVDVRRRGDVAVRELTERFDHRSPGDGDSYEIDRARWHALAGEVAPHVRAALDHAAQRI